MALQQMSGTLTMDALSVKVSNLESGMLDLRASINQQGQTFSQALTLQGNQLNSAIQNLTTDLKKRSEVPWQALGVMITAMIALGALAYWPVRESQSEMKTAIKDLAVSQTSLVDTVRTDYVARSEMEYRTRRGEEDRARTDSAIKAMQGDVFPREVHLQRWSRIDADINNVARLSDQRADAMQREIDDLQKSLGETYTARDAILALQQKVEELTTRLLAVKGP